MVIVDEKNINEGGKVMDGMAFKHGLDKWVEL